MRNGLTYFFSALAVFGIFFAQTAFAAQKHNTKINAKTGELQQNNLFGVVNNTALQKNILWPQGVQVISPLMAQADQKRISASKAKSIALKSVRGARFVNVKFLPPATYRVRLQQKNGRIIDVYVDAYTGSVKN